MINLDGRKLSLPRVHACSYAPSNLRRRPRPIVETEIGKYGSDFALYRAVRPGLTGLWQVSGRTDTSYGQRVALDTAYIRNWSFRGDLQILLRTVRVVLFGHGAY